MPWHKKLLLYLLIVFLPTSYFLGYSPILLSLVILNSSLLAYLAYAKDKSAATKGQWRVPEKTLHLLSLFFGWPGAIIAQERLRHKTKKLSFRFVFWVTVLINFSAITGIHSPRGQSILKTSVFKTEHLIETRISSNRAREVLLLLIRFY
jgi:uncharacterized membrane protein YsdA (DUF1294 family)